MGSHPISNPDRFVKQSSQFCPLLTIFQKFFPYRWSLFTLLHFFLFGALLPISLTAQEESNSRLDRLTGGDIGLNLKWSGEAFSNLGSRADAMGGSISTLIPGAESISSNPAGLGFARGFEVTLDWAPPLKIDPGGILGIQKKINNALITAAENNNPPIDSTSGKPAPDRVVDNARVTSKLDMRGGLKGGALMYGNPLFTLAASFHQPFRVETQLNLAGMEFLAASLDDQGKESNRIFGTINGNFNMNLVIESSSFGFGTRVLPNLSLGMVYETFNGEMNFEGTFLPEGIIAATGGETRSFNDPSKPHYDSLYAVTKGDWEGNGVRYRWGAGYHPTPNISLDAVVVLPANIDLRGPSSIIYNNIRALNLDAGEDEDILDADILVEDRLTKTEKKITKTPGIDIETPGSFAFGFSAKWDNYLASAVYTKYFDHLGYKFSYQQFDSLGNPTNGGSIHQGIDFGNSFRLGIGVEQLILGLGVVFGETFRQTIKNDEEPNVSKKGKFFLPFFSLGGGVKVSSSVRFDYVLSLYNSSFFRISSTFLL